MANRGLAGQWCEMQRFVHYRLCLEKGDYGLGA